MTRPTGRPIGRPVSRPVVADGYRWCGSHRAIHPDTDFTGTERTCKQAKYERHIRRAYGLSREDLAALRRPGGLCPICLLREAKYVDHCHETGAARGFLCQPCNTALGAFGEDPSVFARALTYLNAAIARHNA